MLFKDKTGEAMKFYMRPSPLKKEIKPIIVVRMRFRPFAYHVFIHAEIWRRCLASVRTRLHHVRDIKNDGWC